MSRRKAIDMKCFECVNGDQKKGNWRIEVNLCPSTDCPLYLVRPKTRSKYAR
jgi:hypothetical protein